MKLPNDYMNDSSNDSSDENSSLKFTGKDPGIKGLARQKILEALTRRLKLKRMIMSEAKQEMSGQVPNLIIGSYGYPNVKTNFMASEEYDENENPLLWSKEEQNYDVSKIIELRSMLTSSKTSIKIGKGTTNYKLKEVSMSKSPVDAEIIFEKKPFVRMSFDSDLLPYGAEAPLKSMKITSNPKIDKKVEKAESDSDLKAGKAINELFSKGIDEHYITKVFSAGNLGVKQERRVVPTRWSITAVDDILGKNLSIKTIDSKENDFSVQFGGYLGNYYIAIFLPGPWRYELFETYVGSGLMNPSVYNSASDYEDALGRKEYASSTVGGYYAARLAVLEKLNTEKKKASVLLLRFITDEYWAPLGVWVVREASRKCMQARPIRASDLVEVLKIAKIIAKQNFNADLNVIYLKSLLLKTYKSQKTLTNF